MLVPSIRRILATLGGAIFVPVGLLGVAIAARGAWSQGLGLRGLLVVGGSGLAVAAGLIASLPIWLTWKAWDGSTHKVVYWFWVLGLLTVLICGVTWLIRDIRAVGTPIIGVP